MLTTLVTMSKELSWVGSGLGSGAGVSVGLGLGVVGLGLGFGHSRLRLRVQGVSRLLASKGSVGSALRSLATNSVTCLF